MRLSASVWIAAAITASSVATVSASVMSFTTVNGVDLSNVVFAVDTNDTSQSSIVVSNGTQSATFVSDSPLTQGVPATPFTATASSGTFTYSDAVTLPPNGTDGNTSGPSQNTNTNLNSVISTISFGNQSITLGGLTAGQVYNLQLLASDVGFGSRSEDVAVNGTFIETANIATGSDYNIRETGTADVNGNIVVSLKQAATGSADPNPVLSGILVSTPEPGSLALLSFLGLGLLARRRRA